MFHWSRFIFYCKFFLYENLKTPSLTKDLKPSIEESINNFNNLVATANLLTLNLDNSTFPKKRIELDLQTTNPEQAKFDQLTGENKTQIRETLSEFEIDIMLKMMNKASLDQGKDGFYREYFYNEQDGLVTAIKFNDSLTNQKKASQIETKNNISKEVIKEEYLKIGQRLANHYPGGILIYDRNFDL